MNEETIFPIIDGKKMYQDFTDEQVPATMENLNKTIQVLDYLEQELQERIGFFQSEKRRMCKCIHALEKETTQTKHNAKAKENEA